MLRIPARILDCLLGYAEAAYPNECCGILVGRAIDEGNQVLNAIPCANLHPAPQTHYVIAPAELASAQRHARETGRQIVGFYHSHPDHPAQPSQSDYKDAEWPGCSYLIIGVTRSGAGEVDAFLSESEQKLIPEKLRVIE